MTEIDFIKKLAEKTDCSEAEAQKQFEAVFKGLQDLLMKDGEITIRGFGRFFVAKKAARVGYDPKRKMKIDIEGKSVPAFKPGDALKLKVNGALKE